MFLHSSPRAFFMAPVLLEHLDQQAPDIRQEQG